jgi:hypothetical protein
VEDRTRPPRPLLGPYVLGGGWEGPHARQMLGGALGECGVEARNELPAGQCAGVCRTLDKAGPSLWARLVGHVGHRAPPSLDTSKRKGHPEGSKPVDW